MTNYKKLYNDYLKQSRKAHEIKEAASAAHWEEKNFLKSRELHAQHKTELLTALYMSDNYRLAMFNDLVPLFLEIVAKYEGKQYGEKTKEKIYKEFKEKTGAAVYMSRRSGSVDLTIYLLDKNGYTVHGSSIEAYTEYKSADLLDISNTIHAASFERLHLCEKITYRPNPRKAARDFFKMQEKINNKYEELKKLCDDFDDIKPAKTGNAWARLEMPTY